MRALLVADPALRVSLERGRGESATIAPVALPQSILDQIGSTPLVALARIGAGRAAPDGWDRYRSQPWPQAPAGEVPSG